MKNKVNQSDCVFCNIINSDKIVYENDFFYIIKDLYPQMCSHFLLITKQHYKNIKFLPSYLILSAFNIIKNIKQKFKITINTEKPYQHIEHFHIHIMSDEETLDIGGVKLKGDVKKKE